jgi:hypothetical protein
MNEIPASVFFALFVPFFLGMWILVARILSAFGWSKLADRYTALSAPSPDAKKILWQSASFGDTAMSPNYSSCINAWVDSNGIYLRPSLMFRLFHPMLFLRWNDLQIVEEVNSFFVKSVKIRIAGITPILVARGRLATAFANHLGQSTLTATRG